MKNLKTFENFKNQNIKGLLPGGSADGKDLVYIGKKFGKTYAEMSKQLEIGKLVEIEHTKKLPNNPMGNPDINIEIALDQLIGNPNYYSELVEAGLVDELPAIKKYIEYFGSIQNQETLTKYKTKFGENFDQ